MAYEELKKLLEDWEHYKKVKNILPLHIVEHEQREITTAVKLKVEELKQKNEYDLLSREQQELIKEIIDSLD